MHPPPFNPYSDLLSDWPECRIEVRCGCGRTSMPSVSLLLDRHGDQPLGPLVRRLRCETCRAQPAELFLVAGNHRTCHGGPAALDWAVAIKVG